MTCPKCNNQISQKHYQSGEFIYGDGQLIGIAQEPLIVLSCFRCQSFKAFKPTEQHKIVLYLGKEASAS